MALVLIAVAAEGLEEYDQALKAYKRAIEADEELLLAWQVRFYISESGFPSRGAGIEYGKCPKFPNTKVYYNLTYANSADPDQTAPSGAV